MKNSYIICVQTSIVFIIGYILDTYDNFLLFVFIILNYLKYLFLIAVSTTTLFTMCRSIRVTDSAGGRVNLARRPMLCNRQVLETLQRLIALNRNTFMKKNHFPILK